VGGIGEAQLWIFRDGNNYDGQELTEEREGEREFFVFGAASERAVSHITRVGDGSVVVLATRSTMAVADAVTRRVGDEEADITHGRCPGICLLPRICPGYD